jgi:hypothetical protein
MVKQKIQDPWRCPHCDQKFSKDDEGLWKKLKDSNHYNSNTRKTYIYYRDNQPDKFKNQQKWLEHLLYMPGNAICDGRCPHSLCVHCLQYDSKYIQFNNRSSFSYHRKKHCPYKHLTIKNFAMQYKRYSEKVCLEIEKECETESKQEELDKQKQKLLDELKIIEEKKQKEEEDFRLRAKFYDAPPPRSQASIDREKKYKKCKKEIAIEEAMSI